MGGNSRQKKSSSSFFSFFKSKGSHSHKAKYSPTADDSPNMLKIWPSHEDGVHWVAEPGIDRKASAFIAKFHESRRIAAAAAAAN